MRFIYMVLISAMLVGCGTSVKQTNQNKSGSEQVKEEVDAKLVEQEPLIYKYEVTNHTPEQVKMEFTSSQRFDYSVKTEDGEEIFLFSSVVSFLQAIGEEQLESGKKLEYDIDLTELNLEPGNYELTAWMTPKDGKRYAVTQKLTVQ